MWVKLVLFDFSIRWADETKIKHDDVNGDIDENKCSDFELITTFTNVDGDDMEISIVINILQNEIWFNTSTIGHGCYGICRQLLVTDHDNM